MTYTYKYGDRPIDGVTVQRAVGRGGFGEVYYALTDSGKQIALKYLRDNPEVELRGISNVLNLKSPYLVTIFDVKKSTEGDPFVIMEYISGPSLRDLMNAEPNGMPLPKAAYFLHGISKGLAYLHDRGIVHRDLKPANIFFDDGYVKIGDYGLSKHMSVSRHSAQTISVGTVHYMAPEIGSGNYSKAIDVYALGVILYEMITGRLPFHGSSMGEILMKHLSEQPSLAGVPEPFATVIAKALHKDPTQRYQDANEMLAAAMSSPDVSANVAGFDVSALTQVMRAATPPDPEMTLTAGGFRAAPPPPPPPLDVHEAGDWRAQMRNARQEIRNAALEIRDQVRGAVRNIRDRGGDAGQGAGATKSCGSGFSRFMTMAVVALIVAFGMSLLYASDGGPSGDMAPMVIALMFFFLGGTLASRMTYRWMLNHEAAGTIVERLLYAGVGLAVMSIGLGPASAVHNREFPRALVGPVVAMGVCNWRRRVESGRSGRIKVGDAIAPAIVGAIAAGAADGHPLFGAGIAAMVSLLTQLSSAGWPKREQEIYTPYATPTAAPPPPFVAASPASPASPAEQPGGVGDAQRRKPFFTAGVIIGTRRKAADAAPEAAPAAVGAGQPAPMIIDASQPSFVGRAANVGLGAVGKVLCVAAIAAALLYHGVPYSNMNFSFGERHVRLEDNKVLVSRDVDDGEQVEHTVTIQRAAPASIALAFFVGASLLILARRSSPSKHRNRAVLATVFGGVATVFALRQGGVGIREFMATGHDPSPQAVMTLVFFSLALLMLFWPAPREPRAIIV